MNRSGQSVVSLQHYYKIPLDRVLVVHDDIDLEPGCIRLKRGGGHGGHNGLRDIINKMGGNGFLRLRLGIGHPGDKNKVTGHVLKKTSLDDKIEIDRAIDRSIDVFPQIAAGDHAKAMNQLHEKQGLGTRD